MNSFSRASGFLFAAVSLNLLTSGAAQAVSPEELLNFKNGPLNQTRPMSLSTLVETLATYHTQYTRGTRTGIPRITVYTQSNTYGGFLLQVDATGGEKTVVMATVADNERFPHPGIAYIRLDAIQSIAFAEGETAPVVQK